MRTFCIVGIALSVIVAFGCGEEKTGKNPKAKVKGKVTLDGKPLSRGTIAFDANNGEPPAVFDILDGKYEGEAHVGKVTVNLAATKKTTWKEQSGGQTGPGYEDPTEIDILPKRYKGLTREIKAGEVNVIDFDAKSK